MLDVQQYRMSESLAKQGMGTWLYSQVHRLDVFALTGFPVRVDNLGELEQIAGSMHDNSRYDLFQKELSGFDEQDLRLYVDVLADYYEFHMKMFRRDQVMLLLPEIIAHLALYKALFNYRPDFESVLEIGPGSGMLSFFLRRHKGLKNYSQIEVCESFYLLQSLINLHLFGAGFNDRALPQDSPNASECYVNPDKMVIGPATRTPELNARIARRGNDICHHYPWWRIGELVKNGEKFDFVTSNANLLEFAPEALDDYVSLMHEVLTDDGIVYIQCFGSKLHRQPEEAILKLYEAGFRSAVAIPDGKTTINDPDGGKDRYLALGRGIFVKAGHPLYDALPEHAAAPHFVNCEPVKNIFFTDTSERREYDTREIFDLVLQEIDKRQANAA